MNRSSRQPYSLYEYVLSVKWFCCLGLFVLTPVWLLGQVVLSGVVIDGHSKEPIPFANIYLQSDPTIGGAADFDGRFELAFEQIPDTLEVSALGYKTIVLNYEGNNELTIEMETASMDLSEVIITPDETEDPAYAILRKVIENKPKNNRANFETYSCEVYNKMQIDLINITEEFKKMKLNKQFQFVYDHIDSTSEDRPFLPLFVSEALSDFYYQNNPKKENEQIKAVKIVGDAENESVGQLLGVARSQFNAYDNWIELIDRKFAGPVSDKGPNLYRYYLVDSAFIEHKWCYQIQYFPKHKGINGFYGDFWVHDSTFAIKKIKLQLLEEAHLNFVEQLSIILEYDAVNDSIWVPKKDYITISSSTLTEPFLPKFFKKLRENAPGIQAKRNTTYRHFNFEKEQVKKKIDEELKILPDAFQKDATFWDENRHVDLSESEKTAYFLVDTIKKLPIIKVWEKVATTVFTGYLRGKYVDIGNVYEFISSNEIEGFRSKIGFRTNKDISSTFMLGAYAAYGWGDRRFKFGLDFLYMFKDNPRRTFGLSYIDDFLPNSNIDPYFSLSGDGFGTNFFLRRNNIPLKLQAIQLVSANYYHEWKSGLSARFSLNRQHTRPLFNFSYTNSADEILQEYDNIEAAIELRYVFNQVFLSNGIRRTNLASDRNGLSLRYSKGIKGMFGGDLSYDALAVALRDKLRWGALGYTITQMQIGKIWGTLPYLNMYFPVGNERYFMNLQGFNTLPDYSLTADRYAYLGIDHHFDGFLFQLIPFFRKNRIRSVIGFSAMLGGMSNANRFVNRSSLWENTTAEDSVRILVPSQRPFMEANFGIENIFRFVRVDAVWRLNYKELPGNDFGLRLSLSFTL